MDDEAGVWAGESVCGGASIGQRRSRLSRSYYVSSLYISGCGITL